ncbi:Glutamate receptor ionotropic, delta-1 [Araneus ventricosus]|uniref:Glutamate receptor ionotropic, delta-1 n=1 Tax=Araneus ventricosus TaxID=182803 RepID=A0A4Y2RM55_ARAVE|nr:Glutamate receptor ionotropic, delta-1 [Araneus ventricosus]GBN76912.1 Glutamate receptor ionotropic, delta-1 [Araneus ventricosus]
MVLNLTKASDLPLIKVAVVPLKGTINIISNEDRQISASGTDGLLMDAVLKALGYRYELTIPSDREWGRLIDGNLTGLIGEVVNNRADLAWIYLTPTEERHEVVDFSNIYYSEAVTFAVTKPYPIPTAYAIFYPFDLASWIGVFAIIFLMPLLFLVMRARYSYLELFLNIFASILKQPLMISINSGKVLILLISWLLFTQLISCFYSSVLLSFLTKPLIQKVVRNFRELSNVVSKGYLECFASKRTNIRPFLLHSEEEYLKNLGETIERKDWPAPNNL